MDLILTIVRHGNTFEGDELTRRIGSRTDLPLTAGGRAQAAALARTFARGIPVDTIMASPLRRTQETAAPIAANQACPPVIETCDWLTEIDHGPDENQLESVVRTRIGQEALDAWDRFAVVPPGWTVNASARIMEWHKLMESTMSGHIVLVSSNGVARFALLANDNIRKQAASLPSLKLRTGAFGRIVVTDGFPEITTWDQYPD